MDGDSNVPVACTQAPTTSAMRNGFHMLAKGQLGTAAALGLLAAGLGAFALSRGEHRGGARPRKLPRRRSNGSPQKPTVQAAQRLNRAAGLIATSTLLDSGIEHYREIGR